MNITLSPQSEQYLREQLAAGKFPSADAVVAEALRRMSEFDRKMDELRRDIAAGIEQADAGLTAEFTERTLESLLVPERLTAAEQQVALRSAGLRAGWDDPEMDVYDREENS